MADLNKQLQEYLAQSKSGGVRSVAVPVGGTSLTSGEPETSSAGIRRWLDRVNPFSSEQSAGPSTSPGTAWPWSPEPDPCLPGLSRWQRLVASGMCMLMAAICFGLAAMYTPLLLLRARKFALLWSLGSVFGLAAAAFLRGPSRLLREPSLSSVLYLTALCSTLYASLSLHSTILTVLGAAIQIAVIGGYFVTLVPGGSAGMRYLGSLVCSFLQRRVSKTLPV
uniref:Vesicle transport protein n=1 Tax=Geotrypetes seraphini TaxID=260995 RepID=A0A6P8SJG5_GEOSA|nr:vesicle transport protein SFT2C [Geotrypetes seraphini]XP_033815457.1 vesicle transport protein SFT2C [Geotrypetes seraphini]XP_033815458.1 vesicle transport protein SFT2C [Geotrypetes seraphini]XP_033815459.1 vesicle transport protein SFT2C [Geotrypetes seraphini]XP_033815460.1 vesicle transport protein SFT2C [Geotrypetes seraphini]XP_033815461.1 vesicle transport protein SFT2C [Geotrypetes seraphini]XP_033815462.1 vesicle transport protein SFT2C [Geotrypetes seraphini]XP_033815463.1 ves